ncbi:MAG TPA: cytochrome c3 family protein, partial [Longimicrobiaceae bacterium]|nr:cytochrome c3 family protein [Longimicrobiaceae bacterium]
GALHAGGDSAGALGGVASHAELARQCGACHAPPLGGGTMAARCLACHTAVRAELADTTALHGVLPDAERCLFCHTEHQGPQALLTDFSGEGFDHARLGFSLAAHRATADGRPFACADCHGGGTFRFRAERCESCHRDYQAAFVAEHVREWGNACQDCHEGTDRFSAFRHDTTAFRLTGRHLRAECGACHGTVRAFAAFARAPSTCYGCHRDDDEHRGRLGTQCGECHNTVDWEDAEEREDRDDDERDGDRGRGRGRGGRG